MSGQTQAEPPAGADGLGEAEPDEPVESLEVFGLDETASGFVALDGLVEVARLTLVGEGVDHGRLDLVAVDEAEMAQLNQTHMGHQGPTDVLAFPLDGELGPGTGSAFDSGGDLPIHLGDVVVCPEVARRQAPEHCGTEEAELTLLVVHGVLHVLGHDHREPDETARMRARERHHLSSFGYRHPEPDSSDGAWPATRVRP